MSAEQQATGVVMVPQQQKESIPIEKNKSRTTEVGGIRRRSESSDATLSRAGYLDLSNKPFNWHGSHRAKLVQEGYRSLAIMTMFIAGVQAQLLQMSYKQTDTASQVVNAFFFAGLIADIGASILSAASARWYEMLSPEEADHIYDWLYEPLPTEVTSHEQSNAEEKGNVVEAVHRANPKATQGLHLMERWMYIGLKAGLHLALTGLGCLATGVMVFVWVHTTLLVRTLVTVVCVVLVLLLPPFMLPHNRAQTLIYVKLRRFSNRETLTDLERQG